MKPIPIEAVMIKFTANQMVDVLRQLESVNLRSVLEDVDKESYNSIINNLKEAIGKQEPQSDQVCTKGSLINSYTFLTGRLLILNFDLFRKYIGIYFM